MSPDPARCHRCGAERDPDDGAAALLWAWEPAGAAGTEPGVAVAVEPRLLCPECVRGHARDIEARLAERWW